MYSGEGTFRLRSSQTPQQTVRYAISAARGGERSRICYFDGKTGAGGLLMEVADERRK